MSANREKKLNTSDVRSGIWKFIISFVILSAISFCSVFFFFKSYDIQQQGIQKEIDAYRDLLGRNELLRSQVDSIYQKMSSLDTRDVSNDIFLRNQISDDVRNAKNIIGADSAANLRHYSILLNKIKPMLILKDQIIKVSGEEQIAIRDLTLCMEKGNRLDNKLKIDPTRKFTGRRR